MGRGGNHWSISGGSVSGSIDQERFGDEGLAAAVVLKERPRSAALPSQDFLAKSAVLTSFLNTGFAR